MERMKKEDIEFYKKYIPYDTAIEVLIRTGEELRTSYPHEHPWQIASDAQKARSVKQEHYELCGIIKKMVK